MSMDSIAAEAGASKPTLYRRWPSKADLATGAVRSHGMALVGTVILANVLTEAKRRGERCRGVKIPVIVNMLVCGIYAHHLASPDVPETYPADLVAAIWNGMCATGTTTARNRSDSAAS